MSRRHTRRGVVFLELLISIPITVIFLTAVIQFALIKNNMTHVVMASRIGAKVAAEGGAIGAVKTAVDRYLDHAGLDMSAGVSTRVSGAMGMSNVSGTCPEPATFTAPIPSTQVRVCIELTKLTPNLLDVFGFDIAGKTFSADTTFPNE